MQKKYITKNFKQTQLSGEKFAKELVKSVPQNGAVVLALQGDLGSGKTTFLQGFAKGLGIKDKITSPTFVIYKKFTIPEINLLKKNQTPNKISRNERSLVSRQNIKSEKLKFANFFHIDCYRIDKPEEILELGFEKIISNPENIVAIEWPEKIKKNLPKNLIIIKFKFINKNKREIFLYKNKP